MRQVQLSRFGQPSAVAQIVDTSDPGEPSAWELVIDVEAFPINVADLAMLSGRYGILPKLPSTIGMEAVGTVRTSGSSVKDIRDGDRVVLLGNNNWAQTRRVPATTVHKVPRDLDVHQMSMLKVNPATAYLLLTKFAELQPGDWIIQSAPLGSVGQCVVQLAKQRGIRTINVVRRPGAIADVLRSGGDIALEGSDNLPDAVRSQIGHDRLTLALDAVAGAQLDLLARTLNEGGCIVNYGMLSGESCSISAEQTIFRNITLQGFWLSKVLNRLDRQERQTLYDELVARYADGTLQIPVDTVFPFSQITDALALAEQAGRRGKIIVDLTKQRDQVNPGPS
ncbi:MAG: zinc-dependent alcohol dehydrogenase family protein [Planctomycetaceae bacterium]